MEGGTVNSSLRTAAGAATCARRPTWARRTLPSLDQ